MDIEILGGQFKGNNVLNVFVYQVKFDVIVYLLCGLMVVCNGIYVGLRYLESDYINVFFKQDFYFVVNVKVMYMWKNYIVFVDIFNLLNKKYDEYGVFSLLFVELVFYFLLKINFLVGILVVFQINGGKIYV